jgi:DNA-binding MarR family transcriptional regulator
MRVSVLDKRDGTWTLLTGHGRVLVEIARNPGARIRDISAVVGLTERTVQVIVADLQDAGYLRRTRVGRRSLYTVKQDSLFRHSAQEGHTVGPFLALLAATGDPTAPVPTGDPGSEPSTADRAQEDHAGPDTPAPSKMPSEMPASRPRRRRHKLSQVSTTQDSDSQGASRA